MPPRVQGLAWPAVTAALLLSGCSDREGKVEGYDNLVQQVEKGPVGQDPDHWIEYKNMAGDWEKTGLIFGYLGDFEECQKAIAGLKSANPQSEYRCISANLKKP